MNKKNYQPFKFVITFLMLLMFTSCAVGPVKNQPFLNANSFGSAPAGAQEEYILGIDDVVKIVVDNHPEWSGEFVVEPSGKINVPGLGDIIAQGTDKEQLKLNVSSELERYINNPKVTVSISKYVSQVIYVLGEVNKPGKYSTEGKKLTLRDVVVNAGMPTRFAAINRTFVISATKKYPKKKVINLYRVLYQGDLDRNIEIMPGDVVYVPETLLGILSDFLSSLFSPFNNVTTIKTAGGAQ